MTKKILGKITCAEFGQIVDYPFLFGLQLYFSLGDGTSIGCGSRYTVNINEQCGWDKFDIQEALMTDIYELNKILNDAKVSHVSQLINKPVEVEIENNTFKDFRILTEVL